MPHVWHNGAPSELWANPGEHGKQAARPVSFWCVPASQGVHRVALVSPPPRTYPRGQAEQLEPIEDANWPAAQDTHDVWPPPAVKPAGHLSQAVAPGSLE